MFENSIENLRALLKIKRIVKKTFIILKKFENMYLKLKVLLKNYESF